MLYKDVLEEWIEQQKTFKKYSTYTCYQNIVANHLMPELGSLDVSEITSDTVQDFVIRKLDGLSHSFVRDMVTVIKMTLDTTIKVKFPYCPHKEVEIVPYKDLVLLINHLQTDLNPKGIGVLLTIHTGLRIGELCALKWSDIDLDSRLMHVRSTMIRTYTKRDGSHLAITSPKSKSSVRTIPLNSWISHLLNLLKSDESHYLLTGSPSFVEPNTYRKWYKATLQDVGIDYRKFHALRHTFATNCISCGCDYKSLSQLLGHADVATTMNLYVHPQMELKRKCVENLADFYSADV